jgi:hypothetical protein
MPPKKNKKSIKKTIKIVGGDGEEKVSSVKNFTSTRAPSPVTISPRSNEALYTNKPSSASRLLTVPATAAASLSAAAASAVKPKSGGSLVRYFFIFLILGFLALTLVLYLEKPSDKSITQIYDPLVNFFKPNNKISAIDILKNKIDDKAVVNNIDKKGATTEDDATDADAPPKRKKYKKRPVDIPEADDATSKVQMKPKSKAGFCYIGEDRGFRSCIEVGEGDVCMSGDIFPTEAICINPNLRE